MKAKGKGAAVVRPLQREDDEFPARTGTQRTRNSPVHAVTPTWAITRSHLRRGGRRCR